MIKWLKVLMKIFSGFLIIFTITMFMVSLFINPNQFKGYIEQIAFEQTGQTLKIEGPIKWHWSPLLALDLENVSFNSPDSYENKFIKVEHLSVGIKLETILSGKILLNVKLQNPTVTLIRNKAGHSNWENLIQHFTKTKSLAQENNSSNDIQNDNQKKERVLSNKDKESSRVLLGDISIQNGELIFKNEQEGKHYRIEHFNLSSGNLMKGFLGLPTETNVNFNFSDPLSDTEPTLKKISLTGTWAYLAPYLKVDSLKVNLHKLGNLTGYLKINLSQLTPEKLQLEGYFSGAELQLGRFPLSNLKGTVNAKEGLLNIAPLQIQLANSLHNIDIRVNLKEKKPAFIFKQEASNFEINPLLSLMDIKDKIEGKTNLKINLTAKGNTIEELRESLSGHTELEIKNGKFYGIDLINMYKQTQSTLYNTISGLSKKQHFKLESIVNLTQGILQQKQSSFNPTAFTPFNTLTATTTIVKGVIHNPDLVIEHSEYQVKGIGTIYLSTSAIQYKSSALLKNNPYPEKDDLGNYLYNAPLPISIEGTLSQVKIRPDFKTYSNNAIVYAEKKMTQDFMKENVNKVIDQTVDQTLNQLLNKI